MTEPRRVTLPAVRRCRYPIGDPKEPGFRFCNARDVVPAKPYCLVHCLACYQRPDASAGQEQRP